MLICILMYTLYSGSTTRRTEHRMSFNECIIMGKGCIFIFFIINVFFYMHSIAYSTIKDDDEWNFCEKMLLQHFFSKMPPWYSMMRLCQWLLVKFKVLRLWRNATSAIVEPNSSRPIILFWLNIKFSIIIGLHVVL